MRSICSKYLFIIFSFLSTFAYADFCVVNNFGQRVNCLPTLDACRLHADCMHVLYQELPVYWLKVHHNHHVGNQMLVGLVGC